MSQPLPIHEIHELFGDAAVAGSRVLLKAPTGSGKSTVVPIWMQQLCASDLTVVVEPRRMAARLLAEWVAQQQGVALGAEVGYAVRYDSKYGEKTRLLYLTDGLFLRMLQENPGLKSIGAVIFDEFHERRLAVDVSLARCLHLQETRRPEMRVVVMSATLATEALAAYLGPRTVELEAKGRTYPVSIHYRSERSDAETQRSGQSRELELWERVGRACLHAVTQPDAGNVLIFLPGVHEIRKTIDWLSQQSALREWEIEPLYSAMPTAAQQRTLAIGSRPKIIVSSNVAETSLTIAGVRTVIDSGLARIALYDPRRGVDTLLIHKISRASADQRAGRAGRTAPGRCYRLWSEASHAQRPAFEEPEVRRIDLAETILQLHAAGFPDARRFRWIDAPSETALARAETLLQHLSACDEQHQLTPQGHAMAELALPPRFAKLLLEGLAQNCVAETAFIAAAVQSEAIFTGKGNVSRRDFHWPGVGTDFAAEYQALMSAQHLQFDPQRCHSAGISARAARELAKGFERMQQIARQRHWPWQAVDFATKAEAVGHAMLSAFSDQLAMRLNQGTLACRVLGQRRGKLDELSVARHGSLFVATEITEVEGRDVVVHLRRATVIEPEWIQQRFPHDCGWHDGVAFDETRKRVIARRELRFHDLVLERKESDQNINPSLAAELLAQRVRDGDIVLKNWDHEVEQWTTRLQCLTTWCPELELPGWSETDRVAAIAQICHGALSAKEVKDAPVWPVLKDWLNHEQHRLLDLHAPEWVRLASNQRAKVTYHAQSDPVIALRVQHLFGIQDTPCVGGGRIPVLIHILAPNQRPWQMTKDLRSFWQHGYLQMRKELAGRYPKHNWPEKPQSSLPS